MRSPIAGPTGMPYRRAIGVLLAVAGIVGCEEPLRAVEDAGHHDAGPADAGPVDAGSDGGGDSTCAGDAPAALFGLRRSSNGDEHTLVRTETATLYGVVASGAPRRSALPSLYEITRICGDEQVIIARDAANEFVRIDYDLDDVLSLCVTARGLADEDAALRTPAAGRDAILSDGCHGAPFLRLEVIR